jgi:hypothetical protein
MVNIDEILNQGIELKLFGNVIHVSQPTYKMTRKMGTVSVDTDNQFDTIDKQLEVLAEILSNNTEKIKVTKSQLEGLPMGAITTIINAISGVITELENHPN